MFDTAVSQLGTEIASVSRLAVLNSMKGEKMLDKMSAHCSAQSVASGDKKYIDGACVLTDSDKIFSTFDTRDLDKSQRQAYSPEPLTIS